MARRPWIYVWVVLGCTPAPAGSATAEPDATAANDDGSMRVGARRRRRGEPVADGGSGCERLEALADCVHDGITTLQREPVTGELSLFVTEAQAAAVPACAGVSAQAVAWERRDGSFDHYDDGRAVLHIEYRFRVHACEPVSMQIELETGG